MSSGGLSLPASVLTFLKWLESTNGRDKLYRLIQYGSKPVLQFLKDNQYDKDTIDRLSKGASAVGLTRKLMRFFRSLEYTNEFLKSLAIKDEFERYVTLFKSFCLAVWMVVDHVQWMNKAGYLKLGATPKMDEIHSKAWLYGLFFGVVLNIYKLRALLDEERLKRSALRSAEAQNNSDASRSASKDLVALDDKKNKQLMGLVKNSLDMVIPAQRLQWLPVSDGTAGVAGTITSIIGIQDTWPKADGAKSK